MPKLLTARRVRLCLLRLLVSVSVGSLGTPHAAADQVGTAIVNGRTVILDSDKSWHFKDDAAPGTPPSCDTVKELAVCAKSLGWISTPSQNNADYAALYSFKEQILFRHPD